MKSSILKLLVSMVGVIGLGASAHADMLYTFDTGLSGTDGATFTGGTYAWDSSLQAVRSTSTVGGWNLGGAGPKWEFSWPSQSSMWAYAASGVGKVSFDIVLDDNSWLYWNNTASGFYQIHFAFNGQGGWTQDPVYGPANGGNPISGNVDTSVGGTGVGVNGTYHFGFNFSDVGWGTSQSFYQIFFGSNSDGANAVNFSVDNISITPEPSTFALAGLGAAALMIFRRRK